MSARAGIVVTGTEVLTGRVQDANGPWIADRLLELGVELAHITICGDRPRDIEAQLRYVSDEEASTFAARADALVLPYRSATGSGVVAFAYHFGKPVSASLASTSTRCAPPTASRP